ncbi:F0F1 ATP synthase subunit A [Orientia tsutsugamushi]|uniref:ATP synthase subunit a n=1 Tax=Orientia tsutsugamushi (strain Boryong) TaxID=357244 RepID=ATP6_ORITB|nr:F0F1 ATP synthase subunit A [Orientia tsutsugamushi]A5CDC5.1 RecName: Full=ATP synthase subunit a; AltName: Full=ATP synthase F0 sector subunit a; AltName: Full=F-ATPase subunit 6 [Orientia tsutsugamushi str. Boryong]CAM79837.1 ATP synthase subunit A [Orientia tsutsugamushi str. Boryong]
MLANPLSQFLIKPIIPLKALGYNISITNSAVAMIFVSIAASLLLIIAFVNSKLVPSRWQAFGEILYESNIKLVHSIIGPQGKVFFPLILTLFLFISLGNIIGMVPHAFTFTSHIIVTFSLAMIVFTTTLVYGIYRHKLGFFSLFLPKNIPLWLAPIMVIIELCVFISKPISLSLRLTANMVAGHILLKIIAWSIVSLTWFFKPLPIALVIVLIGFELFISILQAYIFTILSCVYLRDVVNLH